MTEPTLREAAQRVLDVVESAGYIGNRASLIVAASELAAALVTQPALDREALMDAIGYALPIPTMLDVDFPGNTADAILAALTGDET